MSFHPFNFEYVASDYYVTLAVFAHGFVLCCWRNVSCIITCNYWDSWHIVSFFFFLFLEMHRNCLPSNQKLATLLFLRCDTESAVTALLISDIVPFETYNLIFKYCITASVWGEHGREETERWISLFWNWYGNLVMCRFFACCLKVLETLVWHSGFYWRAAALLELLCPANFHFFWLLEIIRSHAKPLIENYELKIWKYLGFSLGCFSFQHLILI